MEASSVGVGEELVRDCSLLLSYVHLQEDTVDLWQCKLDRSGVYFFSLCVPTSY